MIEGLEPFFYVAFQGVTWGRWVGEGGECVPEEVVVVCLRSDVVESGIGRTLGQGLMQFADREGFVGCANDLLIESIAEVLLVGQPGGLVGRGGKKAGDAILGEDGIFVAEQGRESVLRSTLCPS